MSIAPQPADLEHLSGRPFAFYPPIRNILRNEWLYRRATWSECIVLNLGTGDEFSVPRSFLGEVSVTDEPPLNMPAMVVELNGELECRKGAIVPSRSRVIELPVGSGHSAAREASRTGPPAQVISIRLEPPAEPRVSWWGGKWNAKSIGAALVLGVVACSIVADIARQTGRIADAGTVSRAWLDLRPSDDHAAVLARLGPPARERSFERRGRSIRVLMYPALRFSVVLSGPSQAEERYVGAVDTRGRLLEAGQARPSGLR